MARTNDFSRVLWLVTSTWLAGCGRIGFGEADHGDDNPLADAPIAIDAAVIKGPPVVMVTPPGVQKSTCGDAAGSAQVRVQNTGETDLVITSVSTRDGVFHAELAGPLTIGPNSDAMIDVTVPAAVIGTDVGGDLKTDQLQFQANVAIDPIELVTKVMGANLVVVTPAPPASLVFTGTSGACPIPRAATLRNVGNMPVTMTISPPANFAFGGASSASMAGGASTVVSLRPFTTSACSGVGTIQYQITGSPNCGASGTVGTTLRATYTITGASTCFCS